MTVDFSRSHVIDGAMATELERRGARLGDALWSARILMHDPDLIRTVHLDYFRAGADVAVTASYQATIAGFARHGIDAGAARRLLRSSVELALEARRQYLAEAGTGGGRPPPLVAASMGPYGAHLHDGSEYRGDYGLGEAELIRFHRHQLEVLADTEADFIAFETIPSLAEARALLALLGEFPKLRAWLSFSCRDACHVSHGERFAQCVALANGHPQVLAVGLNCTAPVHVEPLLIEAGRATALPLLAYPNSGEIWQPATNRWAAGAASAVELRAAVHAWRAAGARLIGGCCRTTPADIRLIGESLH
jgi:homocysteine S-methyltransferase